MSLLSTFSKAAAGLALAAGLMATAIPATAMAAGPYTKDNPLKVVLVVHGTLGDKSFFDSAAPACIRPRRTCRSRSRSSKQRRTAPSGSRPSMTPPTAAMTWSSPAPSR